MVAAPIIHVNGDDVDAVCQVMELACEWRDTFRRDIIIDICCFRKHGHNESDEPRLTQPQMYQAVDAHPGTLARYGESLARRGLLTQAQQDEMTARYRDWLDSCQKREPQPLKPAIHSFSANWYGLTNPHWSAPVSTALPRQKLAAYGEIISTLPPDVVAHPTIKRQLALRQDMAAGTQPIDWGMAEMLAMHRLWMRVLVCVFLVKTQGVARSVIAMQWYIIKLKPVVICRYSISALVRHLSMFMIRCLMKKRS